jgi:hypothetical protein
LEEYRTLGKGKGTEIGNGMEHKELICTENYNYISHQEFLINISIIYQRCVEHPATWKSINQTSLATPCRIWRLSKKGHHNNFLLQQTSYVSVKQTKYCKASSFNLIQ